MESPIESALGDFEWEVAPPYKKYLLSGACYVQACYCLGAIKTAAENGVDLEQSLDIQEKIDAMWESTVEGLFPRNLPDPNRKDAAFDIASLAVFMDEARRRSADVQRQLVRRVLTVGIDRMDSQTFFDCWIDIWEIAYQDFVRSKGFIGAMSTMVNFFVRSDSMVMPEND